MPVAMPPAQLPEALGPILDFLDMAGIAVFALSGALLAAVKRQTLVTFVFFAVVTGVGGGTVRDLIIGAPVFWVHENHTLLICFGAALAVWLTPARFWSRRALLWLDAVGLAAYSTFGAAKGLAFGLEASPPSAWVFSPAASAASSVTCWRGALDPDAPRLYVTVAALSAALLVGLTMLQVPGDIAGPVAALAGFALRAAAIWRGWALPAYGRYRQSAASRRTQRPSGAPDPADRRGGGAFEAARLDRRTLGEALCIVERALEHRLGAAGHAGEDIAGRLCARLAAAEQIGREP